MIIGLLLFGAGVFLLPYAVMNLIYSIHNAMRK